MGRDRGRGILRRECVSESRLLLPGCHSIGRVGPGVTSMRVGYVREQRGDGGLLQMVRALETAGCGRIVVESAARRRGDSSPALAALMAGMEPGDTIVVPALDHLAGTLPRLLDMLEELTGKGLRVEVLTGEFDTGEPAVRETIRTLHGFALRATAPHPAAAPAMAEAAEPLAIGRPRRLTPADIARARMLIETGGVAVEQVARELGVSRATLYRSLKQG